MKTFLRQAAVSLPLVVALTLSCARADDKKPAAETKPASADTEPLKLQLPAPTLKGTPEDMPTGPNIEPISDKPRPAFLVPKGVQNVAAGKSVTSSVKPFTGELTQLTDGKKEAFDYDAIEMKKGLQWVQVDLGQEYAIHAVAIWHDHRYIQLMHDVIVQVSNDPEFKTGVTTLFNNDTDNSSGLGVGTDREYFETQFGRVIDGKGTKGRYVRGYTKGGSLSALNCWQEIEVYALPAGGKQGAALRPWATGTTASVPPVILKSSEAEHPTLISVTSENSSSSTLQTVEQTTIVNNSAPAAPAQLNLKVMTRTSVTVEAPPTAQPMATATTAPVASGFDWAGILLTALVAILLLAAIYSVARSPVRSSVAHVRAK